MKLRSISAGNQINESLADDRFGSKTKRVAFDPAKRLLNTPRHTSRAACGLFSTACAQTPDQRRIVLLGIGHTNASIVHRWASDPLPDTELVCISDYPFSTYSGMLPGTLAGQYSPDEMQIDLRPLVEKANGTLLLAEVNRVDPVSQTLFFRDHAPLRFDALSVGIGSVPAGIPTNSDLLVPIKPMQTFLDRFESRIDQMLGHPDCTPKICVVGGGVAGVEISLCLHTALSKRIDPNRFSIHIFTGAAQIADGLSGRGVKRLDRILEDRKIHVSRRTRVTACDNHTITTDDGKLHHADCVVWTTGASAPGPAGLSQTSHR